MGQLRRSEVGPPLVALTLVAVSGIFLLDRAAAQARDTIRKHHLEDLEHALYSARNSHGTFPPYNQPQWCGPLDDPNSPVRAQIEEALRAQNEKYANPNKPFPIDPQAGQLPRAVPSGAPKERSWVAPLLAGRGGATATPAPNYFYWKRNPAVFELYAMLETDPNAERRTASCPGIPERTYDYGLTSVWRENI